MQDYYGVVMAGGVGSRFWPASREAFPKQFHDMMGTGKSLLQNTYYRMTGVIPEENILILTNARYHDLVKKQLPYLKEHRLIGEPAMRNTAPAIVLAALKIYKENENGIMVVAPSDHFIQKEAQFWDDLQTSLDSCQRDNRLMTLGIQPTGPNTGFGYIEYNQQDSNAIKSVKRFAEKPDHDTAVKFLEAGNYLWNAGIFIWKAKDLIDAFAKAEPKMLSLFESGMDTFNTDQEVQWLGENYSKAENISIDYAIMERANNVFVLPVDFGWNDLGTWTSLHELKDKDAQGNAVVQDNGLLSQSKGNMVMVPKDKKVVLEGLEDYIVVDTDDVLMIVPKTSDQAIKQIRNNAIDAYGESMS